METKNKKQTEKLEKENKSMPKKKKSKIALWWEKNPEGIGSKIINMCAVLK
ncbi:MAG: hypothetical protein FWF52_02370 [Candidatus Azobacteroides sp.]|nr:hypothetical protein [Candidatus Azobacteroides sp.]